MAKVQMTDVPADVLRAAQQRLGYSDRDMATRLHLGTEKTWWRWRTEGRVPTGSLPAVALVLELPELLERFTTPGVPGAASGDVTRLEEQVEGVQRQLDEVLRLLHRSDRKDSTAAGG